MNFILYDDSIIWNNLLPLTFTRPISEIRFGILTVKERWEKFIGKNINYLFTKSFLLKKYSTDEKNLPFNNMLLINSSYLPDNNLVDIIFSMKNDEAILFNNKIVAIKKKFFSYEDYKKNVLKNKIYNKVYKVDKLVNIQYIWDIFIKNSFFLKKDFLFLTKEKKSHCLLGNNILLNKEKIFLKEDLEGNNIVLNAKSGPIYIEKEVTLMEGTVIRGPAFIGKKSILHIGSKIYGGTTIGPSCKMGGEIENSIFFSYSNKAHNGFIGNSVVGEWCNLGAGTNVSNLRNDYSNSTVWSYENKNFIPTGIKFFGVIMGDHSKSSIHTQFNTATVVGVGTNIFGYGFPPRYIPSFSLGGIKKEIKNNKENKRIPFKEICKTANIVMNRRGKVFSLLEKEILEYLYKYKN
ncbi:putative sugar nucleotidyl transferase [Blattabacterium cuenoti]|uniref:putative sugar nucleotidyl transferase n=1 Tax=Blattabacterium cuenoti TaxID=1653831 RepID=UPI00163CB015|nr:putative sugar nucleotidyl transferase [Blattabacterium cuenoti]